MTWAALVPEQIEVSELGTLTDHFQVSNQDSKLETWHSMALVVDSTVGSRERQACKSDWVGKYHWKSGSRHTYIDNLAVEQG